MRTSDAERQRVIDELRRHLADGRIDVDDYGARLEEALAATSLTELDHARRDLPFLRIAVPGDDGPRPVEARMRALLAPGRLRATIVVLLTAAVVAIGVVLALVAQWIWILLLVVGYVAGVVQGRVFRSRR